MTKKSSVFFSLSIGVCQVFFLLCCTLWRTMILVPSPSSLLVPPLTREYWFWFIDEYASTVPYEDALVSFYTSLFRPLLSVVILGGLLWLLVRFRKQVTASKGVYAGILAAGVVLRLLLLWFTRTYGQPYFLFMDFLPVELYSLMTLAVFFLLRRTSRSVPCKILPPS